MKATPLHLPLFQKFDCHSCGYCCRDQVVNVTKDERRKIIDAGWVARIPDQPLFVAYRFRGRRHHQLAHRADGACVFLGENGLCRLHAETGIHVKPLTCRMFPFVPNPGAGSVRIDLRVDCPSVAKNQGQPLTLRRRELAGFVEETHTRPMFSLPEWKGGRQLSVEEFDILAAAFGRLLSHSALSFRERLRAGCMLLDLLYSVRIRKTRDERFVELLHLLSQSVIEGARQEQPAVGLPDRSGRLFRQWLFLHSITDAPADLEVGVLAKFRRSWARYLQARQFASGTGPVPLVRPDWPATTFEAVAAVRPARDEDFESLCRSMQMKLDAHAFCGPGYYGRDVLMGLTALWLLPSLVGWFSRLEAVKASHEALTADDVVAGLRRAHHTFGVSPVFARISERLRLHAFARPGVPGALLAHYGL